jgi:hypothetical protein
MRLEQLEISGFGRLGRARYGFGERLTVVLGPNESGKSTLHRAIRAALYGLDAGGPGRPRERSEWARWAPWAGDRYGVVLGYRLDSGVRLRVAQSFDRGRMAAQVQELGGGDVTHRYRAGRAVSPARFHLGMDEAVFCAAGWLGEDGLRLGAPEAPSHQAARVREALERLVDSGPGGMTAAHALDRLEEGLRRVGSERRSGTPLGVATAEARRIEAALDAARRRLTDFAGDEARLRELEVGAAAAADASAAAHRAWLQGRIAQLDAELREMEETAEEVAELTSRLEGMPSHPGFPVDDEARVIALGGELHQLDRAAEEASRRWSRASRELDEMRSRRRDIATGLAAMPPAVRLGPEVGGRVQELRRRLAVASALSDLDDEVGSAGARDQALRREIAVTRLGGVGADSLQELAPLIRAALRGERRARALATAGAALALLAGGAMALAALGRSGAAVAAAALLGLALLGVGAGAGVAWRQARQRRRQLATSLPGLDLGSASLARLASSLPMAGRLHQERERRRASADAGRAGWERARSELDALLGACLGLAAEVGAPVTGPAPRGDTGTALVAAAEAALVAVDGVVAREARRRELLDEDAHLAERESSLVEVGMEAERRREAALAVEARIRSLTSSGGIDPTLPPLAAVAAFREACGLLRRREHLGARLAEARRREGIGGADPRLLARRRTELLAELGRLGGDPAAASPPRPDPAALAALERAASASREAAAAAGSEVERLRARLEGMRSTLAPLADLEDERLAVGAARERAIHQQAALQRAAELIRAAGRDVHNRVAPRLAASVSRRVALLTGDRYREVDVDIDQLAVSLASAERDQMVPLDLVSHGTRDQVALLLRLALCEVLGEGGESMPLLLDEPMVSSDPRRRSAMAQFLAGLADTNQLVVTASDPALAACLVAAAGTDGVVVLDLETGARLHGVEAELIGAPAAPREA